MNSLVRDGKVVRGHLGVYIQDVTPALAESFHLKTVAGAVVSDIAPDSPAAKAGLKSGDVVLQYDGKAIPDSRRLKFAVAASRPGEDVKLNVLRDGKEQIITAKIGAEPGGKRSDGTKQDKDDTGVLEGVGVSDLTQAARGEFDIPRRIQGALVTDVDPASAAAQAGLTPGDVIQEINHQPVRSAEDAIHLTEHSDTGKTLLKLWSRDGTHFLVVDESQKPVTK